MQFKKNSDCVGLSTAKEIALLQYLLNTQRDLIQGWDTFLAVPTIDHPGQKLHYNPQRLHAAALLATDRTDSLRQIERRSS